MAACPARTPRTRRPAGARGAGRPNRNEGSKSPSAAGSGLSPRPAAPSPPGRSGELDDHVLVAVVHPARHAVARRVRNLDGSQALARLLVDGEEVPGPVARLTGGDEQGRRDDHRTDSPRRPGLVGTSSDALEQRVVPDGLLVFLVRVAVGDDPKSLARIHVDGDDATHGPLPDGEPVESWPGPGDSAPRPTLPGPVARDHSEGVVPVCCSLSSGDSAPGMSVYSRAAAGRRDVHHPARRIRDRGDCRCWRRLRLRGSPAGTRPVGVGAVRDDGRIEQREEEVVLLRVLRAPSR